MQDVLRAQIFHSEYLYTTIHVMCSEEFSWLMLPFLTVTGLMGDMQYSLSVNTVIYIAVEVILCPQLQKVL
jgi:hypothetical protein